MSDDEIGLFGTQEGAGVKFISVRDVVGWRERMAKEHDYYRKYGDICPQGASPAPPMFAWKRDMQPRPRRYESPDHGFNHHSRVTSATTLAAVYARRGDASPAPVRARACPPPSQPTLLQARSSACIRQWRAPREVVTPAQGFGRPLQRNLYASEPVRTAVTPSGYGSKSGEEREQSRRARHLETGRWMQCLHNPKYGPAEGRLKSGGSNMFKPL